jgi:hypothetical protein
MIIFFDGNTMYNGFVFFFARKRTGFSAFHTEIPEFVEIDFSFPSFDEIGFINIEKDVFIDVFHNLFDVLFDSGICWELGNMFRFCFI